MRPNLRVCQVLWLLAAQDAEDVLHYRQAHAPPALVGKAGHVGREHDLIELEEGIIQGRRLGIIASRPSFTPFKSLIIIKVMIRTAPPKLFSISQIKADKTFVPTITLPVTFTDALSPTSIFIPRST